MSLTANFILRFGELVRFLVEIEILISYSTDDGTQCLRWYHGVVEDIVNSKTNHVRVRWDEKCVDEHVARVTDQKLLMGN